MKAIAFCIALLITGCVVLAGCTSAPPAPAPATPAAAQDTHPHYTIGVDPDFPPFTMQDHAGNFTGFDIDAARIVAEQQGFEVSFTAVRWDDALPALESGKIDLLWSGLTISPERSARVNFSVPYYRVNRSIAVREGSGYTMEDFHAGRLRIGAQNGTGEVGWVQANLIASGRMPAANLSLYPDVTSLTTALADGSVDASFAQTPAQAVAIRGKPLVVIGNTGTEYSCAVAMRKTDPALQAAIDTGLSRLMADPAWERLRAHYGLA
ncbi:MAG: amino acid ABC transporter substrate-binding protein [Methanomicrobiales archaeon]|nr:amino acid ABC transporter substrate-binding protein [Methanomicrobiales archaeon]